MYSVTPWSLWYWDITKYGMKYRWLYLFNYSRIYSETDFYPEFKMGKRMSKVICKLSMFKITETRQPGLSGICCLSSEKTNWMFEHKQSSSFDKVCSDQSIDASRPFFSWCKWASLHACRHRSARSSFPDMPAQMLWLWREKPKQGAGMEEGETVGHGNIVQK